MKKFLVMVSVILISGVLVSFAANTKTTSKFGVTAYHPIEIREFIENEMRQKYNLMVNDLDTIFAHLAGQYADSLYKKILKNQKMYGDTIITLNKLAGNPVVDSLSGMDAIKGCPIIDSIKGVDYILGNPVIDSISGMTIISGNPIIDSISGSPIINAATVVGTLSGDSLYSTKGVKTAQSLFGTNATLTGNLSADSAFSMKGIRSAQSLFATNATLSGIALVDTISGMSAIIGNPIIDSISGADYIAGNPLIDSLKGVDCVTGYPFVDSIQTNHIKFRNAAIDSFAFLDATGTAADTIVLGIGAKVVKLWCTVGGAD